MDLWVKINIKSKVKLFDKTLDLKKIVIPHIEKCSLKLFIYIFGTIEVDSTKLSKTIYIVKT